MAPLNRRSPVAIFNFEIVFSIWETMSEPFSVGMLVTKPPLAISGNQDCLVLSVRQTGPTGQDWPVTLADDLTDSAWTYPKKL